MSKQQITQVLERTDLVLLSRKAFEGTKGIVIVKTNKGYYHLDTRYGLYVCTECNDVLNQEMAVYDEVCPCCRLKMGLENCCEQIKRLGL